MKYLLSIVLLFASLVAVGQTYSKDLEKAAKKGDVAAQRDLGICYFNGAGIDTDNQKAFQWLCQAALQDVQAQYYLGVMFEEGRADPTSDKKGYYANLLKTLNSNERQTEKTSPSLLWYLKAASGNSDEAQLKLAYIFRKAGNEGDAIKMFQLAADLGNSEAQKEIDKFYQGIKGITIDKAKDLIIMSDNVHSNDYEGKERIIVLKNVRSIPSQACQFSCAKEIIIEEGDEPLHIGQDAFYNITANEIIFNRPVYIERGAFRMCCPKLLVFNKDVDYIGEWAFGDREGVKKIVFKKVPKKLANGYYDKFIHERSDYPRENYDEINVPAGTENAFVALGIPREKIYSEGGGTLALSIQLEKPNSILSVLSPDKLSKVDSLTITGFMYETDLKILEDCKNMRYLDLSKTYITYSPEKMKEQRAEKEYLAALFSFMGEAADAKFNNYEMGVLDHAYVKGFAKLMEQSYSVKEADDGCIIPTYAMCNMMKLETLILPTRTSRIGGQTFKNCKALKNVKLPPYLHTIGSGAFFGCESLDSIDFPASLTSIGRAHTDGVLEGEGSFMKTGLKKIDLSKCKFDGNYNRNMWYFRLKECPTQEIHFPSGVERIHFEARQNKNSLTIYVPSTTTFLDVEVNVPVIVHFASPTPPKYNTYKIPENSTVYVPKGSMTAYYSVYGNSNKYIEE